MIKEPRLRFTEEERADPALEKPIRKAEKAAAKADKAQAKIPKKQVKRAEVDPKTGKVTTKLVLEDKPRPASKLSHTVRDAPGNAVAGKLHQEIRKTEDDNVGVESAHKSEEAVETGVHLVREGYRSHKLKPYRKAALAEQKLEKANIEALFQKSVYENPAAASNPLSRWQQKQQIKKQYAAAKRAAQSGGTAAGAAQKTGKAAKTVKEKAQQAGAYVMRHKKGFGIVLAAAALSFGVATVCLLGGLNIHGLLPAMPYWCGVILGLSLLALTALFAVGCVYYGAFLRQLIRSFGRFQHNASGLAVPPPLPINPQFSAKAKRRLRVADLTGAVRRLFRSVLCGVCPVRRKSPVLACMGLVRELR